MHFFLPFWLLFWPFLAILGTLWSSVYSSHESLHRGSSTPLRPNSSTGHYHMYAFFGFFFATLVFFCHFGYFFGRFRPFCAAFGPRYIPVRNLCTEEVAHHWGRTHLQIISICIFVLFPVCGYDETLLHTLSGKKQNTPLWLLMIFLIIYKNWKVIWSV